MRLALVATVLVATFAARLPDLGEPAAIPLSAVVGGFLGAAWSRLRGRPREDLRSAVEDGAFWATGIGLGAYLFGLVTDLY